MTSKMKNNEQSISCITQPHVASMQTNVTMQ